MWKLITHWDLYLQTRRLKLFVKMILGQSSQSCDGGSGRDAHEYVNGPESWSSCRMI